MKIPASDPSKAIKVIKALADETRRRMLVFIQQNPRGVTASNTAVFVNKKIPTILHHLTLLEELGLIYNEMVDAGSGTIKHWFVTDSKWEIELDLSKIAFIPNEYILKLFINFQDKGVWIREFFPDNPDLKDKFESLFPELSEREISIILSSLKKEFHYYLREFIDNAFFVEKSSGNTLAFDMAEFQKYFYLDNPLTQKMVNDLLSSGNYEMSFTYGSSDDVGVSKITMTDSYFNSMKK